MSEMPVTSCGGVKEVIEVLVIDDLGQPVADLAVALIDAGKLSGLCTGSDGLARFDGLKAGSYRIALPDLAAAEWDDEGSSPLHAKRRSGGTARAWSALETEPERAVDAATGSLYYIRRRGSLRRLRIRFLFEDGTPRAAEGYIALVVKADGSEEEAVSGETDDDGFMTTDVPADAQQLEVTIGPADRADVYNIWLDETLAAADDTMGLQMRLDALGYYAGEVDGEASDLTREAVAAFQEDLGLEVTGEADAGTVAKLKEVFGA